MADHGFSGKQIASIAQATAVAPAINLWHGAVRSGKTIGSLVRFIAAVARAPRTGEIVIVGRTRDTVHRNIIRALQDPSMFGPFADQVIYNRGAPTALILGREVHIIGASDVRAENVIRGMTVCVAYADEVTLMAAEFFAQLIARMSVPGAQIFGTTNPDGPRHWLKTDYIDRAALLGHRIFHFSLRDNADHLPAGYIVGLEAQYSGLWRKRMIDGLWSLAEGAIYPMFDPELHVCDDVPVVRLIAAGVDYGVTNPTRGVLIGLGDDGRLWVTAEWAPGPGTEAERSASLTSWVRDVGEPPWVFVDPAAAGFRRQLMADGWTTAFKAANPVLDGIGLVASLLTADRLRIHSSCVELLGELPGYVWDADKAEKGEDAPVKLDDHSVDALRYAILTSAHLWRHEIPLVAATRTIEEAA